MKHFFLSAIALICAFAASGQNVDVDKKTGLVSVDDKDAFYLIAKSVGMMDYDYSLQNLEGKELAYLKHTTGTRYNNNGTTSSTNDYLMVFSKTGNQCTLTGFGLITGTIKPMAKMIAAANLVQNGEISEAEERKFVVIHKGSFINGPARNEKVIVMNSGDAAPRHVAPADISLKETNIYNNSELVGVFRYAEEAGISTISVYNTSDALVCKATHPKDNPNADWTIVSDGKTATILYNTAAPLEKLFKYLVEKSIL